jgi:putative hydrolase of HD superfamily
MVKEKGEELNHWILEQLKPSIIKIEDGQFFLRMKEYFENDKTYSKEREILEAAHYLATRWEFQIVYESSKFLHDANELKEAVEADIHKYKHLKGVTEIALGGKLSQLIDLCGRLRFQIRWSLTPRIPRTSVLGHMFVVSIFSYFYSKSINACKQRLINNFFTSLFHDLPEALTRDIISPVKRSVDGLEEIILEIEIEKINNKILPLVPNNIKNDFAYLLGIYTSGDTTRKDEFKNRIKIEGMVQAQEDLEQYNKDEDNAVDGIALKASDDIAAFTEAAISIGHGITSRELAGALEGIKKKYENKQIYKLDISKILIEMELFLTKGF